MWGLQALGFPRGPIRELRIESLGRGWLGRKVADCTLVLDADRIRQVLDRLRRPDDVFRTWVHESLHGRRAYSPNAERERPFRGFEEGLVEGLARLATRDKASMDTLEVSYRYYVSVYRALALVLECEDEELWRALWKYPTGAVRTAILSEVERLRRRQSAGPLTKRQRRWIGAIADTLFGADRADRAPDDRALERTWRLTLP